MGDYVASVVSGNSKLLKVSSYTKDGAVTLKAQKKTGKTKLTVTLAGGAVKTVNVTIQKGTVKTTKISGVPKKITLKKGKKQTLAPVLAPITTQQKVTYTTSNKKVCTVTKGGVITAKKKRYCKSYGTLRQKKGGYYSQSAVSCKSAKRATPTERKQNIP